MSISKTTQTAVRAALAMIREENPAFYDTDAKEFTSSAITREYFQLRLSAMEYEVFEVLFLDNQHKMIECVQMFRGTFNSASVYPREIARKALELNAASIIMAHNHPSGIAKPSHADDAITRRIVDTMALISCSVLDHLIVGHEVFSYTEAGVMPR